MRIWILIVVLFVVQSSLFAEQFRFLTLELPTPASSNLTYSARILTANATGTVSYSVTVGNIPTGLTLNSATGLISGRPTNPANVASLPFAFSITATDGATSITQAFNVTITQTDFSTETENVILTTTSLTEGEIGTTYSNSLVKDKGTGPFIFGASGLPEGLELDSQNAVIEGTPTEAGTFQVTLTVIDLADNNAHATALIPLTVRPQGSLFRFTNAILDNGEVGSPYADTWTVLAAPGTVAYSAEGLPAGLSVDSSTGVVTGTPTTAGLFRVTQRATSGTVSIKAQQFINIAPSATSTFTWTNYELPLAFLGSKYEGDNPRKMSTQSPNATNGVIYSSTGLPELLAYNSPAASELSGTPTSVGTFLVTFLALSPQQEVITYSTSISVLPRNGGDAANVAAGLFVKSQSVTNSTKPGSTSWSATYFYSADRRTGKIFDPLTENFSIALGQRIITVAPGNFVVKNNTYTFKSAKGVVPTLSITVDASKTSIKLKVSKDTFAQDVNNSTLDNVVVMGGDTFQVKQAFDSKGKLLVTKGYRDIGMVVTTFTATVPGDLSFSGLLADPDFEYEPGSSNTTLRVRLLNADKEVFDFLYTSLVKVNITQDKDDKRFYKLSTPGLSYDSKSGAFNIKFSRAGLANLSSTQANLGVELQFGRKTYFTNLTVFSGKPTKYTATIPK